MPAIQSKGRGVLGLQGGNQAEADGQEQSLHLQGLLSQPPTGHWSWSGCPGPSIGCPLYSPTQGPWGTWHKGPGPSELCPQPAGKGNVSAYITDC